MFVRIPSFVVGLLVFLFTLLTSVITRHVIVEILFGSGSLPSTILLIEEAFLV